MNDERVGSGLANTEGATKEKRKEKVSTLSPRLTSDVQYSQEETQQSKNWQDMEMQY